MGSGNLYARPAKSKKNVKRSRFVRSFLFAGLMLLGMPLVSMAQPTFVNGSTQTFTVCQNSPATDFGGLLTISDPNTGSIETWSVVPGTGPLHGSVDHFPFAWVSTGSTLTTAGSGGLTYQPDPGYYGVDAVTIQVSDGTTTTTTVINIVVSPLPSLIIGAVPAVCKGATSTVLNYSALANVGPTSSLFTHVDGGTDLFVVPPGVSSIDFDVQGAVGGGDSHSGAPNPGNGGRVQGTLAVTPGQSLYIYTGGKGKDGSPSGAAGGFNGGGDATYYFFGCGGAGGGASDIRIGGNGLFNRVVVAGGGGGNGWDSPGADAGGDGGNLIGGSSANNVGGSHSGGGTQTTGGAHATYVGWTPGGNGASGVGGAGSVQGISGGGGGGYYGGGGGIWTGGGGGSSYAKPGVVTSPVYTAGYNIGDGSVAFNYNVQGTYDIVWDAVATSEGFTQVSGAVLPSSPITVAVPPTGTPGTYNGHLIVHNASCQSDPYPFTVTINALPTVDTPHANQVLCNGETTTDVFFAGTISGTIFNWTNDHPGIGLAPSGAGDIPSFTGINNTADPITGLITVTPAANGCNGDPISFTVRVNPTPSLTSTLSPDAICDSTTLSYVPTSATLGTTFTWFRQVQAGISDSTASGADNPNEVLYNYSPLTQTVPYVYTLVANSCVNHQTVTATVYPRPLLSGTLTPPAICDNGTFSYVPASATPGVNFMWNRDNVAGISNTPRSGSNNPLESLHNTTADPITVPYTYSLLLSGTSCSYSQVVNVVVNPSPTLSSPTLMASVCDSATVSYTATSATAGTTFSWNRPFVAGISNLANFGLTNTINENLRNTTSHPVTVAYNFTLTANGCTNTQTVYVTIKPRPTLSSVTNPSVCDSNLFSYVPTSATTGTTFTWTRDTVNGISAAVNPNAGVGNPMEYLHNLTSHSIVVIYKYALAADGCNNTQYVNLTVNPTPKLSSSLTPPAICDSATFIYPPTSNTAGATFSWYRPYIAGIYAVAQTGNGNPNQQLINSTYVVVNVTYNFTIKANGCTNKQDVVVAVNPTPKMNPPYTATVCSGSPFTYTPTSYTPGTTYAWNRPSVNHVTPPTNFVSPGGPGVINETLYDDQLVPQHVEYIFKLSVNGCTNLYTQSLKVTVNPAPEVPAIVIAPTEDPCSHTMYQNFGAGDFQASNVSYHWSAQNATIFAEGANNKNVLVNFNNPGLAVISVNSNVNGYGCVISNSKYYNVGSSVSDDAQIIYYNGQFVCLKNDNSSYQWGYDDAVTLDSTIIVGEIDQAYTNTNPNTTDNHYWCMTVKDGCMQKSYYNAPTGVSTIDAGKVDVKVYPNPAKETVNVEINSAVVGKLSVEVINMLGQKVVATQSVADHKASINVAELPAGAYLVDAYRDGVKIATTRFIKN